MMVDDVKIKVIQCPNCGGNVSIHGHSIGTCKYCGTQMRIEPNTNIGLGAYESPYKIEIVRYGAKVLRIEQVLPREAERYLLEHGVTASEEMDDYMKRKIVDEFAHLLYENFDNLFTWNKQFDIDRFQTVYRADMRVMINEDN